MLVKASHPPALAVANCLFVAASCDVAKSLKLGKSFCECSIMQLKDSFSGLLGVNKYGRTF